MLVFLIITAMVILFAVLIINMISKSISDGINSCAKGYQSIQEAKKLQKK